MSPPSSSSLGTSRTNEHWFFGDKGLDIRRGVTVWVGLLKSSFSCLASSVAKNSCGATKLGHVLGPWGEYLPTSVSLFRQWMNLFVELLLSIHQWRLLVGFITWRPWDLEPHSKRVSSWLLIVSLIRKTEEFAMNFLVSSQVVGENKYLMYVHQHEWENIPINEGGKLVKVISYSFTIWISATKRFWKHCSSQPWTLFT